MGRAHCDLDSLILPKYREKTEYRKKFSRTSFTIEGGGYGVGQGKGDIRTTLRPRFSHTSQVHQ